MSQERSFAEPSAGRRRGRPQGSRNKATLALEAVLEDSAEELTRILVAKALAGDGVALRFCVGLLLPARRDRPVVFELPEIESAGDLVKAGRALLAACAEGIVSPGEATQVMDLITAVQAIAKMDDRETRLIALEKRQLACAAKTSRAEGAPCDRRASPPARLASRRRRAFDVSGCEIDKGTPARRRAACKSPVFNSFSTSGAGHRTAQKIFSILGEGGGAAVTAACTPTIRGPPTHLEHVDSSSRHRAPAYCWSMIFSENRYHPRATPEGRPFRDHLVGHDGPTILYRNHRGQQAMETFELGTDGKVLRSFACHA
jgi:hypothetical protein